MKYRINIIDDEKNLNDLVRTYLEKEGYIVYSFYTYEEAFLHKDDDVHLWIIDIMLDKNSGFDLLNEMRVVRTLDFLAYTDLNLEELAEILGFVDSAHISRVFMARTGFKNT